MLAFFIWHRCPEAADRLEMQVPLFPAETWLRFDSTPNVGSAARGALLQGLGLRFIGKKFPPGIVQFPSLESGDVEVQSKDGEALD